MLPVANLFKTPFLRVPLTSKFSTTAASNSPTHNAAQRTLFSRQSFFFSPKEPKEQRKIAFIPGGTGHLSKNIILGARKKGYQVIATSRSLDHRGRKEVPPDVLWELTPNTEEEYRQLIEKHVQPGDKVVLGNGIGGAHTSKGKSIIDLNVRPVEMQCEGLRKAARSRDIEDVTFVQLSSLAAEHPELMGEYGRAKVLAEEIALGSNTHAGVMRIGYVLESPKRVVVKQPFEMGGKSFKTGDVYFIVDNLHPWSPEHVAQLPAQPLIGCGNQPLQPVSMDDVVQVVVNAFDIEGQEIINVVGEKPVTQERFFQFFTELQGKPFRPVHIPYDVAKTLARLAPHGHFALYAMEYCERGGWIYCSKKITQMLGRSPQTLEEMYRIEPEATIIYAKPPTADFVKIIGGKLLNCSTSRRELPPALMFAFFHTLSGCLIPKRRS